MSQNNYSNTVNILQNNNKIANDNNYTPSQVPALYAFSDFLAFSLVLLAISFVANLNQLLSFSVVAASVMLWLERGGHYRLRMPFWSELKYLVSVFAFALLVDSFLQFTYHMSNSPLVLSASWIAAGFTVLGFRMTIRRFASRHSNYQIPTLLVGSGATAHNAQTSIESAPEVGYQIIAHIKNLPEVFLQYGSNWNDLCADYGVKHIVIAIDGKDLQGNEKILAKLMRTEIPFSVVSPLPNLPVSGMVPQYSIGKNTMLLTHDSAHNQYLPQLAKRSFDIAVSGLALFTLAPIMLVIGFMIKRDGGDALFGHKRLGRDGKVFPCWKFRSMVMGGDNILKKYLESNPEAAAEWKATQKLQNDPRVTRLGKFLRSTSIDELPQLINVLKGDMSLVGPRPIVRDEVANYSHDIAYYYRVRPGVTGLWQVSGRNDVSYAERVQLDSWYVRNWSLWHDIAILCKTFPAVFKRSGAY